DAVVAAGSGAGGEGGGQPTRPVKRLLSAGEEEAGGARVLGEGVKGVREFHRKASGRAGEDAVTLVTQLSVDRLEALARQVGEGAVTLVTQLSVDRLEALVRQVQHWTGLVSAAVLIVDATRDVHLVEEWWLTTPGAMQRVDLHLEWWLTTPGAMQRVDLHLVLPL
ncbi:hypothetical protein T484DRAFT_1827169, partial [Baffinella frigidus]